MSAPVLRLPRGGVIVETSGGRIQLGAPPETIKDAMELGIDVPSTFVMPSTWFSRRRGTTVAELEFPVYYNWFLRRRKVTAVCDEDGRRRLRAILRESLFGPEKLDLSLDYEPSVPPGARADLAAEGRWFRRRDGDPLRELSLDDVLGFALYDASGRAELGGGVAVEKVVAGGEATRFRVWDRGELRADLSDEELGVAAPPRPRPAPASFQPPVFGLTVLGSSHGFDPAGKTTGFVLWVNRHGVLVDPPTDATATLAAAGVAPETVDAVILTHCHADHDAGVLQKLLEAGRVSIYTTPTILCSFLRKVVALTGEPEERLRRLFVFRPVIIGDKLRIQGAEFRFFYSLHSIPTIGFECFLGGKSFAYSADTLYDPPRIEEMHAEGVVGRERRDQLLAFPFHHSLVVHEAGVPPIHTPAARLAELPEEERARLRIIHIAERDLPEGSGLRLARTGFDETLSLPVEAHEHAAALEALDALAAVDLLRDFTVERCREFLTIARREQFRAGSLVIGQGERGDRFYIIVSGEAAVVKDGVPIKRYRSGDFFGETALVTGAPRSADVRATSDLDVVAVDKYDFLSLLRGTDLAASLVRLARNRDLPSWALMGENPVLCDQATRIRTALQAVLEHCRLEPGAVLWRAGRRVEAAWLIEAGAVELRERGQPPVQLGRAAFLCDIEAILKGRPSAADAVVTAAGAAFRAPAGPLAEVVQRSPGLLLALSGARFV